MRRLALLSLSASILATTAFAQEPVPATPPAAPEAAQPAPAAPAAPATPEAVPATPAAPAAPQAAPLVDGVPPAPPAPATPEAPAAPPAPPPAPTDVTSIAIINAIEKLCQPLVAGGEVKSLAPSLGFKLKRGMWTWTYAKGYQMVALPQGTNPGVCTLQITHPVDGVTPVIVDLHNWAMARQWTLYRNDKYVTDQERSTRSWEMRGTNQTEALVLMSVRKADGAPLNRKSDFAEVIYTIQKH